MNSFEDNILRDGTSQKGRYVDALNPDRVQVDGRDRRYYMRYAEKLAKIIRFYNRSNNPNATWAPFFPDAADIEKFLTSADTAKNHSPQLALYLAFTRMMEVLKTDINQLSRQHLNFYYKDVLRFVEQKAVAEKANVTFEISPAALEPFILKSGAELSAGNDTNGNPIIFTTDRDVTLSKVSVAKLSSILVDQRNQSRVYAAPRADTFDGVELPLPKEAPYWNPFGESQAGKTGSARTMLDGSVGFSIASPILIIMEV